MSSSLLRTWNEVISYYSVSVAVIGTIGNVIAFGFICARKQLRIIPTFVFFAIMCLTNAFSLYYWNLNSYFLTFFGRTTGDYGIVSCKVVTFFQMTFSQSSSFLLVTLCVERYLSIKIKSWRTAKLTSKSALIVGLLVVLFFFLFNFHLNLTLTFNPVANKSISGTCQASDMYKQWRSLHTYVYSMIPFGLLILFDLLLIHEVVRSNKIRSNTDQNARKKSKSMSISVILFSFTFIVLTGPHAISGQSTRVSISYYPRILMSYANTLFVGGYFLTTLLASETGRVINYSFVAVAYTFHGSNFLILLITNKKFAYEFNALLIEMKLVKLNRVSVTTGTRFDTKTRATINVHLA